MLLDLALAPVVAITLDEDSLGTVDSFRCLDRLITNTGLAISHR